MKRIALVLLAACGGGPSAGDVSASSTEIVGTNCQVNGPILTLDVTYQTTLGVGDTWASVVLPGAGDTMLNENNTFSCNSWTPDGFGQSAQGCKREFDDQPASQTVIHSYSATFQNDLGPQVPVTIIGNTTEPDNSGDSATDDITCN